MGRRGPAPTPSAVRDLMGNPGHRPVNKDEPKLPAPKSVKVPAGLTGEGRKEWERLAQMLVDGGIVTAGDMRAMENYCRAVSDLARYEAAAKRAGADLAIAKGFAGMVVKLRAQVNQLACQLGLTPSSRSQVKAVGGTSTESQSPLAKLQAQTRIHRVK